MPLFTGNWESRTTTGQTPNTPAVVSWNGVTYYVVRGTDGEVWWTTAQQDSFQRVPRGWITPFAPAAALVNGQLWAFIRGNDDHRIYYARLLNLDANDWTPWAPVPGSESLGTPAVAVLDNGVMVVYANLAGEIRYALFADGGLAGWQITNRAVPGDVRTDSPPAAATYGPAGNEAVAVLHRGVNGLVHRLNYGVRNLQWDPAGWRQVGVGVTRHAPAVAAAGNRVQAAVTGTDDQVWLYEWTGGSTVTQTWQPEPVGRELIGRTNQAPWMYAGNDATALYVVITTLAGIALNTIWGCQTG